MRKLLFLSLLTLAIGCGTAAKMKRLTDAERDHFYALKVYMTEDDQKDFLKLKTEEERNALLQQSKLWDRFYKYDEEQRQQIINGDVTEGWTEDRVYMAWGNPYEKRQLTGRPAELSTLLVYRFEEHEDGSIIVWVPNSKTEYKAVGHVQLELYVDDGRVTEIVRKEKWG